ncbi:amphi-Trp domain-containing protein [Halomicrobium urmianum]|uniref:amphi-Trp domain-containing protein n=1 Tax=Halomicrobium urmianum TaxID=1586233 RepID=UPI001CD9BAD0|nr:amphi-Trp domain-containing protein [Halomicrobium urmianum]
MPGDTPFEYEATRTGAEAATLLRELADAFEDGTSIELAHGDRSVAVDAPEELSLEIELEREAGDGTDALELELEFEWEAAADESVAVATAERDDENSGVDEAAGAGEGTVTEADDDGTATEADDDGEAEAAREDATGAGTGDEGATADRDGGGAGAGDSPPAEITSGGELTSMARFQVFRDRADEWRWRLVHRNGNVIATSGEGYTRRRNAEKGLRSVVANAPGADVEDAD